MMCYAVVCRCHVYRGYVGLYMFKCISYRLIDRNPVGISEPFVSFMEVVTSCAKDFYKLNMGVISCIWIFIRFVPAFISFTQVNSRGFVP